MPKLANVFGLLFLVIFIYSTLGVFLFRGVTEGAAIDPKYVNFKNFGIAMLTLFRCATGEDWHLIMFDLSHTGDDCISGKTCGHPIAPVFFISYIVVVSFIMLNLFILVLIQQFERTFENPDNPIDNYSTNVEDFRTAWAKYSAEFDGVKMHERHLLSLF